MSQRDSTFHRGFSSVFNGLLLRVLTEEAAPGLFALLVEKFKRCAFVSLSALDPRRQRIGEIF